MNNDSFNRATGFTLRGDIEGGFTDDPKDRGNWTTGVIGQGELRGTKYGISAMSYPQLDIKNLAFRDAVEIYRRDYWQRTGCDQLPQRLAIAVFDAAVNHGPKTAVRLLQESVDSTPDGIIGPNTLAAVRRMDQDVLIIEYLRRRLDFFRAIKTWNIYGKGWTNRVLKLAMECAR
jgi:lysozyme family protein